MTAGEGEHSVVKKERYCRDKGWQQQESVYEGDVRVLAVLAVGAGCGRAQCSLKIKEGGVEMKVSQGH